MEDLVVGAAVVRGVHTVRLTGGCPALHPQFEKIVPLLKPMFECKRLEVETNGYIDKIPHEILKAFDLIEVTRYTAPTFIPNTAEIKSISEDPILAGKVHIGDPVVHFPRTRRAPGKTCERGNLTMVSLYKGRVYACAMGWGIDDPVSVPVSKNWLEELKKLPLPCNRCFMAGT